LGYRLRNAGRRILLDRDLRVKHLKKWTFWGLLKTDVLDRGIPWTELILRDQKMPNDLNLQISQRVSIGLVYLMLLYAAEHALRYGGYALLPLVTILFILLSGASLAGGVRGDDCRRGCHRALRVADSHARFDSPGGGHRAAAVPKAPL